MSVRFDLVGGWWPVKSGVQRLVGAAGAVAVATAVNVATGIVTDHSTTKWWASGIVLLLVGVAVQWWLPVTGPTAAERQQAAIGTKVGGSVIQEMRGVGVQTVKKNDITGDLTQIQDK